MPEDKTNSPSRYADILADIFRLLSFIPPERAWRHDLAKKLCFRIKGIGWLKDLLDSSNLAITRCERYLPRMKELLRTREGWKKQGFDLQALPFAARKLVNAISSKQRTPLSFPKAVMALVLCEAIVEALHEDDPTRPPGHEVYDHMHIEPAISYIPGLDVPLLRDLFKRDGFIERLRAHTGQERKELFLDMASGLVVTRRTAQRVHDVLKEYLGEAGVNPPQTRYDRHRKYEPSENEDVDLES